jgi:hypothetical protein
MAPGPHVLVQNNKPLEFDSPPELNCFKTMMMSQDIDTIGVKKSLGSYTVPSISVKSLEACRKNGYWHI